MSFPKAFIESDNVTLENDDATNFPGVTFSYFSNKAEWEADKVLIDPADPATWDSLPADVARKYALAILLARSIP